MTKNKRGIAAIIICIVMSTFLLTVGVAAIDKGSSRKLNSRTDSGEVMPWSDDCISVTATVPGIKDKLAFGIIPNSKYTDYSDRAQVEKDICIYVSGKLRQAKKERPSEFTYTIKFPEGMETPTWANEPVLTIKDPQWIEYYPE